MSAARPQLLLIAPPVLYARTWWSTKVASKPHLHSLAGYVRDLADVTILQLDLVTPPADFDPVAAILAAVDAQLELDGVDLVGISCWTSLHYRGAVEVARRIRALRPELPIVVGGHHPTAVPLDFYDDERLFDFIVRSDGEAVLRRLIETLPARPPRAEVITGERYEMTDPSRIDWTNYPWHGEQQRDLWICFSRGCPFKCTYCAEPQRGTSWSHYSVADALAILDGLTRTHAPRVIAFADPLFGASRQWTEALVDGILARRLPNQFWCETRADLMTPQLLDKLRACNFKVDFGLDTGSETMARRMVKSPVPETYLRRAKEIIQHASAIDLPHDTYVLFNSPGETPETTRETMDYIEALAPRPGPVSGWISGQTFFILPGTETYTRMAEYRAQYGTEIRNPTWWQQAGDHNALATDVLPSAAWRGREAELLQFQEWQGRENLDRTKRFSPAFQGFVKSFYGW